jgi:hypothetical protein
VVALVLLVLALPQEEQLLLLGAVKMEVLGVQERLVSQEIHHQ